MNFQFIVFEFTFNVQKQMKNFLLILSTLSFFLFSCNDDLKKEVNNLQCVISLQNALTDQKIIVSITDTTIDKTHYWYITFSDNTTIQIPKDIVEAIVMNEATEEYTIKLSDGMQFVFNRKAIIYPTGIVVLTQEIKFMKNMEVAIEFRVNPSNAIFNYNVNTNDCQIALDMANGVTIRSYVTEPEHCRLSRIEQAKDAQGKVKEGQYIAYIADKGGYYGYKYNAALVLSTQDQQGVAIQLSSSAVSLERHKDTGLPIVIIQTDNKAEIKDRENWINATLKIDGAGKFPGFTGTTAIRGRGNTTWDNYPKKPYAIKLDSSSEMLGMPSHKRWVLLANYMDRTLIRNHIAFEISRRTGLEWTPRGQFVELVLNDVHLGNYYLCEHIKPGESRLNITEMQASDLDEESITGGYVLEFDYYYDEINQFRSEIFNYPVMIKYPEEEILQHEQFEYIRNYINSFEQLLTEPDFVQTRKYASLIADTTFIDWWFVMELTSNYETRYPKSSYFYKDRMDILKAGPVWDFDWGTFTSQRVSGFYAKDHLYYVQLFQDPVFVNKVKQRWNNFKPLFEEITDLITTAGLPLYNSSELDDALWSLLNSDSFNEDEKLSFRDAVNRMKNTYANRLRWLDGQIINMR